MTITIHLPQVRKLFELRSDRILQAVSLLPLIICTLVSLPAFTVPNFTYAQAENIPAFQDAFWTENAVISISESASASTSSNASTKKEVGPGDGSSILAIVLVNKARSELTGVTGYLKLPSGFAAIRGENNVTSTDTAAASYASTIKPGESFTLYFTINVLKEAKVGAYVAPLELSYSKVLDLGQISSVVNIPFRLTGKVLLDAILTNQNLIAGSPNELRIIIRNEGSADANGATITIADVSEGTTTAAISNTTDDTDTSSFESDSAANATMLAKTGAAADGQSALQTSAINISTRTFDVGALPAEGFTTIRPTIYPSYSAGGTIQTLDLRISYNDAYGIRRTEDIPVGIVISPNPPESVLSLSPFNANTSQTNNKEISKQGNDSILLTAGKIVDLRLLISNNGETSLENLVLSLNSPSDSVEILENSRWTYRSLAPSTEQVLSTQVFAAEDAIASPIEFTIDAEYISGGQSKTDSLGIGAYIDGEIKIDAYGFEVNDIGGTPNLVGNLLNQGNTVALFTTVEMLNDQSVPRDEEKPRLLVTNPSAEQYLGDLSENSPLPFSIPLSIANDTPRGTYPVSIKVDYVDNLRNPHTLVLNGTVNYTPELTDSSNAEIGFLGLDERMSIAVSVLIMLSIAGLTFFIIKRKKGKARKRMLVTPRNDESDNLGLFDVGSSSRRSEINDKVSNP